jgi:hypothetical protein
VKRDKALGRGWEVSQERGVRNQGQVQKHHGADGGKQPVIDRIEAWKAAIFGMER